MNESIRGMGCNVLVISEMYFTEARVTISSKIMCFCLLH